MKGISEENNRGKISIIGSTLTKKILWYNAISPIYSHFTLLLIEIVPCFACSNKKGILLRSKGLLEALLISLKLGDQLRAEWAPIIMVAVILL